QLGGEVIPVEDPRIELPRPAALGRPDRGGGDVPGDPGQHRLVGYRAEPADDRLPGGVDAQRAEGPVLARLAVLGSHGPDRRRRGRARCSCPPDFPTPGRRWRFPRTWSPAPAARWPGRRRTRPVVVTS